MLPSRWLHTPMEQVGDGGLGTWIDIYGVGATMWRMVAGGNPPWDPPNPVKVQKRAYEVLRNNRDPLPSASELGSGGYSVELFAATDACLEITASSRIQTCAELIGKLGEPAGRAPAVLRGRSAGAADPSRWGLPRRDARKKQTVAAILVASALLILLVAGIGVTLIEGKGPSVGEDGLTQPRIQEQASATSSD